jgi:hypothetical protein
VPMLMPVPMLVLVPVHVAGRSNQTQCYMRPRRVETSGYCSFRSHLALPPPETTGRRRVGRTPRGGGEGEGGRARDECDECDASAQLLLVDDGQVNAAAVRRKGL